MKEFKDFKKPNMADLKESLTPEQFAVTQHEATEPPFHNQFWNHRQQGVYVDIVSGEPLFSSLDKFDAGCGWPSFSRPLEHSHIIEKTDHKLARQRIEVRSKYADSHLGHVFDDGPAPTGLRYCINSASLRFVPVDQLEQEGLGQYRSLFSSVATLAGGCFWGVQDLLRQLPGVLTTAVGYTGGSTLNPTYNDVKKGTTGHAEAIEIQFDPSQICYEDILKFFFRLHDPTTLNRQGGDIGTQYRSTIFYHNKEQQVIAERVIQEVEASGFWKTKIITAVVPASPFYNAEDYHQDYLKKNPGGYTCHYVRG